MHPLLLQCVLACTPAIVAGGFVGLCRHALNSKGMSRCFGSVLHALLTFPEGTAEGVAIRRGATCALQRVAPPSTHPIDITVSLWASCVAANLQARPLRCSGCCSSRLTGCGVRSLAKRIVSTWVVVSSSTAQ